MITCQQQPFLYNSLFSDFPKCCFITYFTLSVLNSRHLSSFFFFFLLTNYRECSNGALKTAFHIQVEGTRGPGRPKMSWKQLTERDCREWKLSAINPHDSHTWRSGVSSAMHAANQLSGRGPIDVDIAPVAAR